MKAPQVIEFKARAVVPDSLELVEQDELVDNVERFERIQDCGIVEDVEDVEDFEQDQDQKTVDEMEDLVKNNNWEYLVFGIVQKYYSGQLNFSSMNAMDQVH